MNRDNVIKKLEMIDLPEVELSGHQRRLKFALLNSDCFKKQISMSLFEKLVPVSLMTAVVLGVMVFSVIGTPSQVSASELAQKSFTAVSNLTPEMQAELTGKTGGVNAPILGEAKNAKDLEFITYEQFAASQPIDPTTIFPDVPGFGEKLRTLKFIRFTDSSGAKNIIGINEKSGLPVFGMVSASAMPVSANPQAVQVITGSGAVQVTTGSAQLQERQVITGSAQSQSVTSSATKLK